LPISTQPKRDWLSAHPQNLPIKEAEIYKRAKSLRAHSSVPV